MLLTVACGTAEILLSALGVILRSFDNYYSIPIEDLLQKPTIIELAAIENSDEWEIGF